MYGLNYSVSAIRTKIRQQFEKNRYVADMSTVDVLIARSHNEYQVGAGAVHLFSFGLPFPLLCAKGGRTIHPCVYRGYA